MFKDSVMRNASEVCGKRCVGGFVRKGSEWWSEEVEVAVKERKESI